MTEERLTEEEIDDFLSKPISSYGTKSDANPKLKPKPKPKPKATTKPEGTSNWDSTIKQLCDKCSGKKRKKSGTIVAREAESVEVNPEEVIQDQRAYPTRKDQLPNVRADPGILRCPRRTTRFG